MRPSVAHSLFSALRGDRAAFVYGGAFHEDHSARLIALGESATEDQRGKTGGRGRLAFIMVEAYQNILRHRSSLPPDVEKGAGRSLFFLKCGDAQQQVVACNPVPCAAIPTLENVLSELRSLDAEQLKARYLAVLQREHDGKRKGAGLGLIEMTRRSGNPLDHELRPIHDEHMLFMLAIRIGGIPDHALAFAEVDRFHRLVSEEDILLFYTGHTDPASHEALLRIVEEDMEDRSERSLLRGRVYLAAKKVFDRRAPLAYRGFLAVARQGAHHVVSVGGEVSADAAHALSQLAAQYGAMDRSDVERRYRHALVDRATTTDDADLLELVRLGVEPVLITTFPGEGASCFILMQVMV
jgi:hypothetical protein